MTAVFARFAGCLFALSVAGLVFPGACTMGGVFWGSVLLTVFYVLLRPLMQVLILPFNLFTFGLLTPITDALFCLWASAWVGGLSLGYLQSVAAALLISLANIPYSAWKKRKLRRIGFSEPA